MQSRNLIHTIVVFSFLLPGASCKKFIQVDPPDTKLTTNTIFTSDATANAAITGIYEGLSANSDRYFAGESSITFQAGLSSDELLCISNEPGFIEVNKNQITTGGQWTNIWNFLYEDIYTANAIIEGLSQSGSVSQAVKNQVEGEAKLIRAFCHFYLVNLWGDVPLVLSSDYKTNSLVGRTAAADVYSQIITDLKDAKNLMATNYVHTERIRPNKLTAAALLARVYLYTGKWAEAEAEATEVINTSSLYQIEANLNNVFVKTSKEILWSLQSVGQGIATYDGLYMIFSSSRRAAALRDVLMNAFEPADQRKTNWTASRAYGSEVFYYPVKYKLRFVASGASTEYTIFFRLTEQYLIRAEARAKQNNVPGAQSDINVIRTRAGLGNTTAADENALLAALEHERQVELFTEWGHRWFDLKRWNRAGAVLGPVKGATWQATDVLYPLPVNDMQKNPNLKPQNPGY